VRGDADLESRAYSSSKIPLQANGQESKKYILQITEQNLQRKSFQVNRRKSRRNLKNRIEGTEGNFGDSNRRSNAIATKAKAIGSSLINEVREG
jgi:hypothetical protein